MLRSARRRPGTPHPSRLAGRPFFPRRDASRVAVLLTVAGVLLLAACGSAPTPTPTATATLPTGTATPIPHLPDPTTADAAYRALAAGGLSIVGNSANAGTEPHRTINATYSGWPLIIKEYSSKSAQEATQPVPDGQPPGPTDPPYTFAGANIVIEYGPHVQDKNAPTPDPTKIDAARRLADLLDRLLGPLTERSALRLSATPAPPPSPAPAETPAPS